MVKTLIMDALLFCRRTFAVHSRRVVKHLGSVRLHRILGGYNLTLESSRVRFLAHADRRLDGTLAQAHDGGHSGNGETFCTPQADTALPGDPCTSLSTMETYGASIAATARAYPTMLSSGGTFLSTMLSVKMDPATE